MGWSMYFGKEKTQAFLSQRLLNFLLKEGTSGNKHFHSRDVEISIESAKHTVWEGKNRNIREVSRVPKFPICSN